MAKKTSADEARELYEHRDDPDEWEEEAVPMRVRPSRTAVVSFRLPKNELDALERAAADAGESLSDYLRKAVALRQRGGAPAFLTVVNKSVGSTYFQTSEQVVWSGPAVVIESSETELRTVAP